MKRILQILVISATTLSSNVWSQDKKDSVEILCKADFTYEINNLVDLFAAGVPMNFHDQSVGTDLKYFWNFGDNQTSEEQSPMHVFGLYPMNSKMAWYPNATVCLTVYNDKCKSLNCKDVKLTTDTFVPQTCSAWFYFKEIYSKDSDVISSNFKTYQLEGISYDKVVSWHWNINDSLNVYEQNPTVGLTKQWNRDYNNYGNVVNLTILTADSCTSSSYQFIPWDDFNKGCWVYFTYFKDSSLTNNKAKTASVRFNAIADKNVKPLAEDEKIVTWHWDFGDGTTSDEASPLHTYFLTEMLCEKMVDCKPQYYVCVTTTNADGCTASYCDYVYPDGYPQPACQAKFSYTMSKSLPPVYNFTNNSQWHGGKSFWSFGDGSFSYEENPNHVFKTITYPGKDSTAWASDVKDVSPDMMIAWGNYYTVCLTIDDSTGCTSTYCETLNAYPDSSTTLCNNYVKLTTSSLLGNSTCSGTASAELVDVYGNPVKVNTYKWSTGDVTQSIDNLCANTSYSISVIDNNGCYTAGSFAITDYSYPWVYPGDWKYEGKDSSYIFKYLGNNPDYIYNWKFSDGYDATGAYVPHTFNSGSDNWVELVVTDKNGNIINKDTIMLPSVATKITAIKSDNFAKLYPNPATEKLFIDVNNQVNNYTIEILDLMGRAQNSITVQNSNAPYAMNVKDLPNGMYICRIKAGNNSLQSIKFIKY